MSWQVLVRAAAESDLDALAETERSAFVSEMFGWTTHGPPRQTSRNVLGVEMFDDRLSSGFRITYVIDDEEQRILVVRIREISPRGD